MTIWNDEVFTPVPKERNNDGIISMLYLLLEEVVKKTNISKNRIACINVYGSQNYKLDTEESDIDCECLIFPSKEDLIFGNNFYSKCINTSLGTCHVKDIRAAFNELRKCSPNMLECFASSYILINNDYFYDIVNLSCNYINIFANLSQYRLLRGLEGLLNRYYGDMSNNSKYLANLYRIYYMITKVMNNIPYTETLVPENYDMLVKLKSSTSDTSEQQKEIYDLTNQLRIQLADYYKETDPTLNANILQIINTFEEKLMTKYIKLAF